MDCYKMASNMDEYYVQTRNGFIVAIKCFPLKDVEGYSFMKIP